MRRRWLLIPAICAALTIAAVVRAPQYIGSRLEQRAIAEARASQINISLQQPEYSWLGARAAAADAVVVRPHLFLNLRMEQPAVEVNLLSALRLAPTGIFTTQLYKGSVSVPFSFQVREQSGHLSAELKDIQLSLHPQFRAVGFTSGTLNGEISNAQFQNGLLKQAAGAFSIGGLERSGGMTDLLPLPIKLPRIHEGHIRLSIRQDGRKSLIDGFESTSNLGSISANGEITPTTVNLRLQAALSHEGLSFLGPYLPVLSGGKLSAEDGIFRAVVSGPLGKARLQVTGSP